MSNIFLRVPVEGEKLVEEENNLIKISRICAVCSVISYKVKEGSKL